MKKGFPEEAKSGFQVRLCLIHLKDSTHSPQQPFTRGGPDIGVYTGSRLPEKGARADDLPPAQLLGLGQNVRERDELRAGGIPPPEDHMREGSQAHSFGAQRQSMI